MRTKDENAEPQVGIFWLLDDRLILDSTPVSRAEPYGEAKTHARGHLKHWTELQRTGVVPDNVEYEDPPRGRVVYYPQDDGFALYADPCILSKKDVIQKIMAAMNLPQGRTAILRDAHYRCSHCLYGNEEGA